MKAINNIVFWVLVAGAVYGGYYLFKHRAEYFAGDNGGSYWDNKDYCGLHPYANMEINSKLVSCEQIRAARRLCDSFPDRNSVLNGMEFPCSQLFGQ
jgi:hypothetical protein